MNLKQGLHLAYCTNIHRGQSWAETQAALNTYTLAVRDRVCPDRPYAIGLRLSAQAARELADPNTLLQFQKWLDRNHCYVFTINGFPYGLFHGTRVKEHVYLPDWTAPERLEFTDLLFEILAQLLPQGVAGSVSTVPGSFKPFIQTQTQARRMRDQLWCCVERIARLSERSGHLLHLGLEPEPLCYLETSHETVRFFEQLRDEHPGDPRLQKHLGVNYDTCHLAVEYEEPHEAVARLEEHQITISKIHISSALKVSPTPAARKALAAFADDIYFHQVIQRNPNGHLTRYPDLPDALTTASAWPADNPIPEWRIHFHIPLQTRSGPQFQHTADHIQKLFRLLQDQPQRCAHLEMETYTWEVLPPELKNRSVVDQLTAEYRWTLDQLTPLGLA